MSVVPVIPRFTVGEEALSSDMNLITSALQFLLYNRPVFRGHCVAAQAIGSQSFSVVGVDTTDIDTDGGRSGAGAQNDRYICRTQGWYNVSATVAYAQNGTGTRTVGLAVNGAPVLGGYASTYNTQANNCAVTVTTLVHMNVNDYLQMVAWQDSGATINTAISPVSQSTTISIIYELAGP